MQGADLKSGMRAVTLSRPWPWTISHGRILVLAGRRIPPAHLIGEYIAIHAGLPWSLDAVPVIRKKAPCPPLDEDHPTGIVAVAKLAGYVRTADDPRIIRITQQSWFGPPITWLLEETLGIEPVAVGGPRTPGFEGFWKLPDAIVDLLRHRIRRDIVEWGANAFQRAEAEEQRALASARRMAAARAGKTTP